MKPNLSVAYLLTKKRFFHKVIWGKDENHYSISIKISASTQSDSTTWHRIRENNNNNISKQRAEAAPIVS